MEDGVGRGTSWRFCAQKITRRGRLFKYFWRAWLAVEKSRGLSPLSLLARANFVDVGLVPIGRGGANCSVQLV